VARLGLVKSIDRYDPERGSFTAYAVITICGELKRHFRDKTWGVHVPRRLQDLTLEIGHATVVLTNQKSRRPTVAELAEHLHTSEEAILEAMESAAGYTPASLNAPIGTEGVIELGDLFGVSDDLDGVDDRLAVAELLCQLPVRERRLLAMRFYGNRTQADIAVELGISQMHVSRLLTRALSWLREAMLTDAPARWDGAKPREESHALRVSTTVSAGTVLVDVGGEVDRDTAGQLRQALVSAARQAGAGGVRVQLKGVPLADAAGVAALLAGYEQCRAAGLRYRIVGAQPYVARVLTVSGLGQLLD
jgi:RNA polymerase sigma-B factor